MKKLLIHIIFTVLFVSGQSHAFSIIRIVPGPIDPDETGTFEIMIEDASDFGAFQFDLVHDDAVVTIDSVLLGNILDDTGRDVMELPVHNASGILTFGIVSLPSSETSDSTGADGDGTLAVLNFSMESHTDTTLDFDENRSYITDTAGNALPAQWIGAEIAVCTCRLTINADPGGTVRYDGATIPSGETMTMECGTEQQLEIEPDSCHDIAGVSADSVSLGAVSSHTFICTEDGDYAMHAAFSATPPYTIEAETGEGGSISPSGDVSTDCGSDQGFEITPEQCYHIADVAVDGSLVASVSSYMFENVMADHTISASFALNDYEIEASAGPGGSIDPSGTVSMPCGDKSFTITPDTGYHIEDVLTDGSSQGQVGTYAFTNITGNHTIHASFAENPPLECVIKATAEGSGQTDPSGDVTVTCGSDKVFTITPDDCNYIKDVFVNGESVGPVNSYTFENVTGGETIHAVFDENVYHINASANDGGTIVPSDDATGQCATGDCVMTVKCGEDMCFSFKPDECHHVADVKIDDVSVGARESHCLTNLTENHTIEAVFAIDTHSVTATSEGCGSIEPVGDTNVECGTDQTFTITPETCCILEDVKVNGKSEGQVTEYTFENVTSDHHRIHAVFVTGTVDLADAVSILKLLCDVDIGEGNAAKCADVSGDEKIGMEEVVFILREMSK